MSIDLSQLTPEVVQQIDAEQIHADIIADYTARMAAEGQPVELKVGDPVYNEALTYAHRESTLRQEFQDISLQNMVAFATGANLEHLAALRPVEKQEGETEERFRKRVQLAPEGFSVAGPHGAYVKHGLDADVRVKDIMPLSPNDGDVDLYVLSTEGDGTASAELLSIVDAYLNGEKVRPLNDPVLVFSVGIVSYALDAEVFLDGSLGESEVLAAANVAALAYTAEQHRLKTAAELSADATQGVEVPLSGLMAALHVPGVRKVVINSPADDVAPLVTEVGFCSGITVSKGV